MEVYIVQATENPIHVISECAGTCYGKSDYSFRRVRNCFNKNHMSVFENASITFRIEGISRACSHQLVRHRLASFCQESQRYCKVDTDIRDWFVKPKAFCAGDDNPVLTMENDEFFYGCMLDAARNYKDALKAGIKPEDARYLLPEATKTNLTMTMNVRELFHFLDLRTDKAAQWEIRELAEEMVRQIKDFIGYEWKELIELWEN